MAPTTNARSSSAASIEPVPASTSPRGPLSPPVPAGHGTGTASSWYRSALEGGAVGPERVVLRGGAGDELGERLHRLGTPRVPQGAPPGLGRLARVDPLGGEASREIARD